MPTSRSTGIAAPNPAVTQFFAQAREGRAQTAPPPFRDGDSVNCPYGTEWMRYEGEWIAPGQPDGRKLPDREVTAWWPTRNKPGSQFALVHRLTPAETNLITHTRYISHFHGHSRHHGDFICTETVSGDWLHYITRRADYTRTTSVHLELPSGIVTLHSRTYGDVFFHPADPADPVDPADPAPRA